MDDRLQEAVTKYFRCRSFRRGHLPFAGKPRLESGREGIARILADLELNRGVEVGVNRGGSARIWCQHNPNLHLTCIDPWKGRHEKDYGRAIRNLRGYNVEFLKMSSMESLGKFKDRSFDFVHIDGDHAYDYVCMDIICWSRKLRSGGLMIVHDYLDFFNGGVVEAVRSYVHCHHIDPWYVTQELLPSAFWQNP